MQTDFKETVFSIVARIPEARVISYGQLSMMAGRPRSARIVGQILSRYTNGRDLPCHRVIKSDGALCGDEFYGPIQRELLRCEGVHFLPDGRVDIRACRWDGSPQ